MSNRILFIIIGFGVLIGFTAAVVGYFIPTAEAPVQSKEDIATTTEEVFCTADAMQ